MLVFGFNHADDPNDFHIFFNKNDKPLIYHFPDGSTILMNKTTKGYEASIDGVVYILDSNGMKSVTEGSTGGTIPDIRCPFDINANTINTENPSSFINTVRDSFPCTISGTLNNEEFKAFPSLHYGDGGEKVLSLTVGSCYGMGPVMYRVVLSDSEAAGSRFNMETLPHP